MDEIAYAQTLGGFFQQLESKANMPKLKLKLDGLKELSRHLEPKRAASNAEDDATMIVQLVHKVDRPPRPDTPEADDKRGETRPE
ncbi:MAG: hypothetical protein ACRD4R_00885 [Candidatus Acidiferrales bacterium]